MRLLLALFLGIQLYSCRTTKDADQRHFAGGKDSKNVVAGVSAGTYTPDPGRGEAPAAPFPANPSPIEKGAFYVVCAARAQLPSTQALTVKALLVATHQQACADAETWLRNLHNKSLMIESEELVELQTLALLQNYPHIADVYIKTAKGIATACPLGKGQNCHFIKADFE